MCLPIIAGLFYCFTYELQVWNQRSRQVLCKAILLLELNHLYNHRKMQDGRMHLTFQLAFHGAKMAKWRKKIWNIGISRISLRPTLNPCLEISCPELNSYFKHLFINFWVVQWSDHWWHLWGWLVHHPSSLHIYPLRSLRGVYTFTKGNVLWKIWLIIFAKVLWLCLKQYKCTRELPGVALVISTISRMFINETF